MVRSMYAGLPVQRGRITRNSLVTEIGERRLTVRSAAVDEVHIDLLRHRVMVVVGAMEATVEVLLDNLSRAWISRFMTSKGADR